MTGKTHSIDFSPDLSLPINAVTQKLAFLGISGSGKTYGAGKFVEGLLDAGAQVVVIDTIGNWWGLRVAAGDPQDGYSIPILGGEKGDVMLEPSAGILVADTVADSLTSLIVDVSDFTQGELRRFVTDFSLRLLKRKKERKSPVMVVWEECQDIVPQFVRGESATMVGAVEKLIKKGRNYGIGTVLISQRPQAVNKDVLNQVETVFAFRTNGSQERKAIESWVVHQFIDVGDLVDELPTLPTGTCYCWSPQWLKVLKKVKVGKKWTFDASATPEFGDSLKTAALVPVDLEKFKRTMAAAIEKTKANDPDTLKQKIVGLEAELKLARTVAPEIRYEKIIESSDLAHLEKMVDKLYAAQDQLAQAQQVVTSELGNIRTEIGKATWKAPATPTAPANNHRSKPALVMVAKSPPPSKEFRQLGACARAILRALAQRQPTPLSRVQAATLSGYSHKSSGFANALSELNTGGYIEKGSNGLIYLSATGIKDMDGVEKVHTPVQLLALWAAKLTGKGAIMLQVLAERGEKGLDRDQLAGEVGLSPTSSGFANYLSKLNSNGLIRKENGVIKADPLFL